MFIRKKKYPSGNIGVIVAEKVNGRMRELHTVGIATDKEGLEPLIAQGQEWIDKEKARRHPRLDLFGEERQACEREYLETERVLSNISNVKVMLMKRHQKIAFLFNEKFWVTR